MRRFADLHDALDRTTSTNAKIAAMVAHFRAAPAEDAAWALFVLTGRRFKRLLNYRQLVEWTLAATGVPEWLLGECFAAVGDGAETIALLLDGVPSDDGPHEDVGLARWIEERILTLRERDAASQQEAVLSWWRALDRRERYVLCKLLTGELRVGVSQTLVVRALAEVARIPTDAMAHRLMGSWEPTGDFFRALLRPVDAGDDGSRPYPFCLASPLEQPASTLGDRDEWQAEWKWDGIRAQMLRRSNVVHIWSRGEELVTARFPELVEASTAIPDGTVLDGEIMAWDFTHDRPEPFNLLQRRIGRQKLSDKILAEAPVTFVAYDLLELGGVDVRERPLAWRRAELERTLDGKGPRLRVSPTVPAPSWEALASLREESRARRVEGLMLKRLSSSYGTGRKRGDWWKWKIDPYAVDAVLIYAQAGSGRRASLFTDYTFGLWSEGELVPVAKAYSGLSDAEIAELDRWIRGHTRERHGPVRVVEPVHVFELGFEAIAPSPRHRSGVAVRFPRMLRWRKDKRPEEADHLDRLRALIAPATGPATDR